MQTSDQQRIGDRYELEQTIGIGGMARVYLAHDRTLDREVAVKILTPGLAADPLFVERFRREAQAAAALNHPNIVTIYDTGTTDQTYYIVMEYVPGPNLKEAIRQRGALPEAEALGIGAQVAAALEAAHHRRLIHRDVKSHNVLLHPSGTAKVTDFGIARAAGASQLTATNTVMGTAHYLSPEQALHQPVDGRSDVYSLGVVLYEALSGQLPFAGDSLVSVAMQQVHEQPTPLRTLCPDLSPQTEAVVMKALAKNPAERFQHAGEMRAALLRAQNAIHRAALVETRPLPPGTPDDAVVRATIPSLPLVASASPPAAPIERQRTQLLPPEHRKRRLAVPLVLAAFCALMVGVGLFAFRSLGGGSRATIVSTPTASARAPVVAAVTTLSPVPTQAASPLPAATPAPATLVPPTPIPPTAAPALVAPTATVISPTVAPTVAPPTPTPLAVPTATPAPAPTATAIPPTAAPAPTAVPPTEPPPPVAAARPSGPVTVANSPAQAVQQFYSFASQHNFDAAAGLWSARMKAEFPPGENLNGHFGALRRVDASTGAAQIDPSGTRATVPVEVTETLDSGATRRLQGSWQLVRGPSGWLLDQPNLIAA